MQPYLTKNVDTDVNIILNLSDFKLKEFCSLNTYSNYLCHQPLLWIKKIQKLYPTFPFGYNLSVDNLIWLYFKLKYLKEWSNIVQWADINEFDNINNWIVQQKDFRDYCINYILHNYELLEKNNINLNLTEFFKFLILNYRVLIYIKNQNENKKIFINYLLKELRKIKFKYPKFKPYYDELLELLE